MSEQPEPPKEAAFFTAIREWGIVRGTNGVVGGVVDGLGNRIGLARVPARLLTVFAWILLPGIVLLAYAAGWALLPDSRGNIIIQNFGRGITNVGALIGIAFLSLFGFFSFDRGPIFNVVRGGRRFYGLEDVPFGLAAILIPGFLFLAFVTGVVVLVVWLVKRSNSNTADARATSPTYGTSATGNGLGTGAGAEPAPGTTQQGSAQPGTAPTASTGVPQPWEPALLPGDPRASVLASAGTKKGQAKAAHSANAGHYPPTAAYSATSQAGSASASAAAPPPPAPPARPPAPTVPGPGRGAYLAFAAVLLIAAAVVTGLAREDMLAVSPVLAWGAAITVGLGAILVVVALTGRKLGFLGFLSVFAVLLAVLFAANAEEIRDSYRTSGYWGGPEPEVYEDEIVTDDDVDDAFDLTTSLGDRYAAAFVTGTCVSPSDAEPWSEVSQYGESMASMRLDALEENTHLDLAAQHTRLIIPAGTSLDIKGVDEATVVWETRDASCWTNPPIDGSEWAVDEEGNVNEPTPLSMLSATNPNDPVLTVNAGTGSTIYIQEVAQ